MTKTKFKIISFIGFVPFFVLIIFMHFSVNYRKQIIIVDKHASVVASALWNFDPQANDEYLMQVVEANNYKSINVYSVYEDLFTSIKQPDDNSILDDFFIRMSIIPSIELASDVVYKNEKIGTLKVIWQPRYVYKYIEYFFVILLLYCLVYMWVSLIETNKYLDKTVKQRTEELAKTKSYLDNVVNSMPSALIGIEPDGVITELNREAIELFGMDTNEIKGKTIHSLLPQFSDYLELIEQCIQKREPIEVNKEHLQLTNDNKIVDLVFYPLVTNGVRGAVIRLDDVGLKVRFEEMMVQSEKMLSVGGLAAGMAHEINNPLGAILQGIQNIRRRVDSKFPKNVEVAKNIGVDLDLVDQYLQQRGIDVFLLGIQDAGERAAKIVANMLQFSRKSGSGMEYNDLSELIENTIELASNDYDLKKSYDFRHIEIIKDYRTNGNRILGVRTEIEQVILNLLKNAAHALAAKKFEDDNPRIIIRTKEQREFTVIEIEDNGTGITESVRKRIFDPFFTTKPVGIGTGLGLSISYFIVVESHKGKINVESQEGQWTKVSLSFPKNEVNQS